MADNPKVNPDPSQGGSYVRNDDGTLAPNLDDETMVERERAELEKAEREQAERDQKGGE